MGESEINRPQVDKGNTNMFWLTLFMFSVYCLHLQQGHIRVTELNLGEDFPVLSRARIRPADQPAGSVV